MPEFAKVEDATRTFIVNDSEHEHKWSPQPKVSIHLARDAVDERLTEQFLGEKLTSDRTLALSVQRRSGCCYRLDACSGAHAITELN